MTTPAKSAISKSSNSKSLHDYQLGDSLGKGAFGQVYRALNWATGETVAVKEITLANIPKSELGEIMSEIDLLKNLNHPNIVKYKGFVKTREFLYIILEFCENGSLHGILKRFGKFPENLVAVYISQVLQGLVYLHDQGVIHRDIKGANILTNKDGTVKLADFGVASSTTTGAVSNDAVVGSPYWMAPEVIEQTGATTASDIWSVGCVVIELLEGYPPYHDLDPMPALFRIVQDDCPPIPEGASPIVKDFLLHCFQKDCNLRIGAKKLLRHPWMVSARKQMGFGGGVGGGGGDGGENVGAVPQNNTLLSPEMARTLKDPTGALPPSNSSSASTSSQQQQQNQPRQPQLPNQQSNQPDSSRRPLSSYNYNYDEAVLKVQEWNQALLKSPSRPMKHPGRERERVLSGLRAGGGGSPTRAGGMGMGMGIGLGAGMALSPPLGEGISSSTSSGSGSGSGVPGLLPSSISSSSTASSGGATAVPIPFSSSIANLTTLGTMKVPNLVTFGTMRGPGSVASAAVTSITTPSANIAVNTTTTNNNNLTNLSHLGTLKSNNKANLVDKISQVQPLAKFAVLSAQEEEETDRWDDDFDLGDEDEEGGTSNGGGGGFSLKRGKPVMNVNPNQNRDSGGGGENATGRGGAGGRVREGGGVTGGGDGEMEMESREDKEDTDAQTIRPGKSPRPLKGGGNLPGSSKTGMAVIREDWTGTGTIGGKVGEEEEDLDLDLDGVELEGKVRDFKMKNSFKRGLFHPDDIKLYGLGSLNTSPGPKTAPLPDLNFDSASSSRSGSPFFLSSSPATSGLGLGLGSARSRSPANTGSISRRSASGSISAASSSSSSSGLGLGSGSKIRPSLSPIVTASGMKARSKSSSSSSAGGGGGMLGSPVLGAVANSHSRSSSLMATGHHSGLRKGSPSPTPGSASGSSPAGAHAPPGVIGGSLGREGARRVHSASASEFADFGNGRYYDKYVEYEDEEEAYDEDFEDVFLDGGSGRGSSGGVVGIRNGGNGSLRGAKAGGTMSSGSGGSGSGSGWISLGSAGRGSLGVVEELKLNTRLSNKSWLGDDDDEEDPFAEIDEGFSEEDLEANLQRDKYARLCNQVNSLIDELTPSAPDFQLSEACDQLLDIIEETPEMQTQLVSSHGMLAILEVLEGRCSREVTMKLLQIINVLVTGDIGFLESFCLIGGIPVMMGFTSKKHPSECRLEASHFIRLLCHTSVLTLQMFISCRGLKVLVDLLDEDYSEQADLVVHALNGIGSVFELQSPTTKNDFCRMFIREGLLDPLSSALLNVMGNRGEATKEMKMKIIQILLVFSQVSMSDIHVRNALGTRKVVRRLLRACELLEPECLVRMLKAVKHLSMNVTLLDVLQNANAIEILIRILEEQSSGPYSTEMSNHIFQTCYNLCRLNKSRQEEAAQAGIIPCLKRVIGTKSPLKQFALPILCDLASAGKSCRTLLWQHDGLTIYLKLLEDPYFQVSALESIISWLQDETARVEDVLLKPESISHILNCFVTSKAVSFENLLDLFLKMTRISHPITIGLTKSSAFFRRIVDRLAQNTKAVVRLNLLRILKHVCEVHPNRATLVEKYGLLGVVEGLSQSGGDGAVLVKELAREIVPVLRPGLRPAAGSNSNPGSRIASRNGIGASVTPKRMRRTASETSAATVGTAGGASTGSSLSSTARVGSGNRPRARHRLGDITWQQGQGQEQERGQGQG